MLHFSSLLLRAPFSSGAAPGTVALPSADALFYILATNSRFLFLPVESSEYVNKRE